MENKTHWKKLVNPVYLGVYSSMIALKEGTVTVLKLRTSYDLTQDQLDQIKEVEDAKNTM